MRPENCAEVVVSLNGCVGVKGDVSEELHPDDGVNEEQHHHQHHHVRKGLQQARNRQKRH